MTDPNDHPDQDTSPEAADERPNRFPDDGGQPTEVPALDEAPDGRTPADTTESSDDSLPPG